MRKGEYWTNKQKVMYETALDTYRDRAELNCEWDFQQSKPYVASSQETLEFALGAIIQTCIQ